MTDPSIVTGRSSQTKPSSAPRWVALVVLSKVELVAR
jgi:hypothetical protein